MEEATSHAWIGAFAARLMQLKPGLHLGAAVLFAVQNHESSHATAPERAAEEFAAHHTIRIAPDSGSPSPLGRGPAA